MVGRDRLFWATGVGITSSLRQQVMGIMGGKCEINVRPSWLRSRYTNNKSSQHLSSFYCVASHICSPLILSITLRHCYYHCPHFTDEQMRPKQVKKLDQTLLLG